LLNSHGVDLDEAACEGSWSLQSVKSNWYRERRPKISLSTSIRNDCFQVKSNLLTDYNLVVHI